MKIKPRLSFLYPIVFLLFTMTLPRYAESGPFPHNQEKKFTSFYVPEDSYDAGSLEDTTSGYLSVQTKSLLLPGWGQWAQAERDKGAFFLGTALTTLGLTLYYNNQANNWYEKYQQASDTAEIIQYRDRTESYDIRRNQTVLVFALNYILNMIDIYRDSGSTSDNEKRTIDLQCVHFVPFNETESALDRTGIMLTFRFH